MTTIGHQSTARIAAACVDGTVGIYDSVTGVLRLSLRPPYPIQAMTGSPDGSILFCTHRESPSITLWDIQTGGLIHTFTLTTEVIDTAVSLNGRYLACGFFDRTVNVWEVTNRTGGPAFEGDWPITCLCWLAPEEWLMVANKASVYILDVVAGGSPIRSFNMCGPVCGVAYSTKLDQLAVVTSSGTVSSITVIEPQTCAIYVPRMIKRRLSCFAFSQTAKELVCGMKTRGLALIDVSAWDVKYLDLPAAVTSISTLSNRTVVANLTDTGLQLLSLDDGPSPSRQLIPPTLTAHPLDKGRIIVIVPIDRDRIILLQTATILQVLMIPAQEYVPVPTDRTAVLCASLENKTAVHSFAKDGKEYLQLWKFTYRSPQWTVRLRVNELPTAGDISLTYDRLVTFHGGRSRSTVRVFDLSDGGLLAELEDVWSTPPLDITFDSEHRFYFHHDTYRIPYDVTATRSHTNNNSIIRGGQLRLVEQARKKQYSVDDGHEWVVSSSQRICWIPPGYIGSTEASHCWAGSSLVMVGQDGTLRALVF